MGGSGYFLAFVRAHVAELHMIGQDQTLVIRTRSVTWKPPADPCVKINFDAAFQKDRQKSSSGIIIRDTGEILAAWFQVNDHVPDYFVVEGLAAVQALRFAEELGFRDGEDRPCVSALIKDGKQIGAGFRLSCYMQHKRETN